MIYKIGVVVPVLNYFEGFADFMLSLKSSHELIVYVQPQWITQVPLSAAWNKGAKEAFAEDCDFALICNDDILFAPDCIDNMVEEFERLQSENVIMVTPNNIWGELQPNKYAILNYSLPDDHQTTVADHPNYSCMLIGSDFFEEVGEFDENFNPAWFEDNDSHRRIGLAGKRAITSTACPTVHLGGVTTSLLPVPASSGVSRDHYITKWGGLPGQEKWEHPYNDNSKNWRDW